MESVYEWIARQSWSNDLKAKAIRIHDNRTEQNLNPFTAAQWAKWAQAVSS